MKRLLVLISILAGVSSCSNPETSAQVEAMTNCREMLRNAAKNPSSADIPGPDIVKKYDAYRSLKWTHGQGLRFMNGFGAMLDSSATCETSLDGTHIKNLLIDNELIYQDAESMAETAKLNAAFDAAEERRRNANNQSVNDVAQAAADAAAKVADEAARAASQ